MPKVKNTQLRGRSFSARGQVIQMDQDGIAEVSVEIAERLASLPGYEIIEEAPTVVPPALVPVVEETSEVPAAEEPALKSGKKGRKSASSDKE